MKVELTSLSRLFSLVLGIEWPWMRPDIFRGDILFHLDVHDNPEFSNPLELLFLEKCIPFLSENTILPLLKTCNYLTWVNYLLKQCWVSSILLVVFRLNIRVRAHCVPRWKIQSLIQEKMAHVLKEFQGFAKLYWRKMCGICAGINSKNIKQREEK